MKLRVLLIAPVIGVLALLSGGAQTRTARFAIVNATVVDGTGAAPRVANVVVEGGRILSVGNAPPPAGARLIDASGMTLIPGLFDLHTHITASGASLGVAADWPKNLMAYLYCGVTTIADLGDYQENFEGVRAAIAQGKIASPHVAFASRFSSPGGHGAESGRPDIHTREVETPREARAGMAEILAGPAPDLIKIFTDGWRYGAARDMTSMDEDTLRAIVEEAHKAGLPVITHTVTAARARIAAGARADILGHSVGDVPMDDALLAAMRENGVFYVPTLSVYEPKADRQLTPLAAEVLDSALSLSGESGAPTAAQKKRFAVLLENVRRAYQAGIPVAAGTDAGMTATYHGWSTLHELELLVSAGMKPVEAITAATGVSARALNVDVQRGTIAAGKAADLVLIAGHPESDIGDIEKIRSVFFAGEEVDRAALKRTIRAEALSPLEATPAPALLDDFERADGRASNGAAWVNYSDPGHDRSRALWTRGSRAPGNHTLLFQARMAQKDRPFALLKLPLNAGGMLPVDVRAFEGVSFEARGQGRYRLSVETRGVRDSVFFNAAFDAGETWTTIRIPFERLGRQGARSKAQWTGDDVLAVGFEIRDAPGKTSWLEVDDVRFYAR